MLISYGFLSRLLKVVKKLEHIFHKTSIQQLLYTQLYLLQATLSGFIWTLLNGQQWLLGLSPWVLPERTLGTVRYTETYPDNYLICRTVPSLLQTVPSFETRIPDHRDICKRIVRISVYRLKFLLGFTVSYSNPIL